MPAAPLKRPDLPPGARMVYFDTMRERLLRKGAPSTAQLGKAIGYTKQATYKALTGPKMPSHKFALCLAKYLVGTDDEDAIAEVIELWAQGVSEERAAGQQARSAAGASAVVAPTEPVPATAPEYLPDYSDPQRIAQSATENLTQLTSAADNLSQLTPREREILDLYNTGMTVTEIAERLGSSPNTIYAHFNAIRGKVQSIGTFPANTMRDLQRLAFEAEEPDMPVWDQLHRWGIDTLEQAHTARNVIDEYVAKFDDYVPTIARPLPGVNLNRLQIMLMSDDSIAPREPRERKRFMESGARVARLILDRLRRADPAVKRPNEGRGLQADLRHLYNLLTFVTRSETGAAGSE